METLIDLKELILSLDDDLPPHVIHEIKDAIIDVLDKYRGVN